MASTSLYEQEVVIGNRIGRSSCGQYGSGVGGGFLVT